MNKRRIWKAAWIVAFVAFVALASGNLMAKDQLPSWNEGPAKKAIVDFVAAVTDENGPDFVEPDARIATFDNDGTLWLEYPVYTQLLFGIDQVKALAPQHPEWKSTQPFKAVLEDDMETVAASGMKGLMEIIMASHAGMTDEEFTGRATQWLGTARQKRFDRLYTELGYQPQLELLEYLRANGFKTYIVSGGGIAFMRPVTEQMYGIPPEQVVGSSIETEYVLRDGKQQLVRQPKIHFIDDKATKPVAINRFIGRRPILAFGNSDGDLQMVEYTTAGDGPRLGLFVHHTDAEREYAYDRESHVGKLDKVLDRYEKEGWILVDMKKDWETVFPE